MRGATAPRLLLELLCSRMLLPSVSDQESAVLARLERLERRMTAAGEAEPAPAPGPAPAEPAVEPDRAAQAEPAAEPSPAPEQAPEQAAAPDAVPAEVTSAAMDAAGVRSVWPEVLAAVRGESRSVEAMLSQATVRAVAGQVITLTHQAAPLVRRLADPANTEVVAKALRTALGGEWQVRWEQGGSQAGLAGPPPVPAPPQPEPDATRAAEPEPEPQVPEQVDSDPEEPHRASEDTAIDLLTQQLGASKIDG
jgi:DNA polymerase-3 subunit gamma/tau